MIYLFFTCALSVLAKHRHYQMESHNLVIEARNVRRKYLEALAAKTQRQD